MSAGKPGIAASMAKKTGSTQKLALEMVNAFIESITEKLVEGDTVKLFGFGTFTVRQRKGREGRNPATGEILFIHSRKVPAFRASPKLKRRINDAFPPAEEREEHVGLREEQPVAPGVFCSPPPPPG